mmetsp:Transcript_45028/g.83526  ORF Transcript_45028/g.83526 Transcript_45028/m.83526 type:complete len:231 (-) Transcript_45028:1205-1897(-)
MLRCVPAPLTSFPSTPTKSCSVQMTVSPTTMSPRHSTVKCWCAFEGLSTLGDVCRLLEEDAAPPSRGLPPPPPDDPPPCRLTTEVRQRVWSEGGPLTSCALSAVTRKWYTLLGSNPSPLVAAAPPATSSLAVLSLASKHLRHPCARSLCCAASMLRSRSQSSASTSLHSTTYLCAPLRPGYHLRATHLGSDKNSSLITTGLSMGAGLVCASSNRLAALRDWLVTRRRVKR